MSPKQVIFEDRRKGIINRENFEWNKNDFCKEFKSTKNAVEFVEKFQSLTTFDRVQQIVFQNLLRNPHQEDPGNSQAVAENVDPSTTSTGDDPREEETTIPTDDKMDQPPPAKKQKNTDPTDQKGVSEDVASKKVGKYLYPV